MARNGEKIWRPRDRHLEQAQVIALIRHFKFKDYDELHRFSIEHPDRYWHGVSDHIDLRWSRKPTGYVDLTRGKEFPSWFPGGELNWVDTVLKWADVPGVQVNPCIVKEHEDGSVQKLSYAELPGLVKRFAAGLRRRGIEVGDRVGLLCENGVEATISFLAIAYIGAIAVPLFSGFGSEAIVSRLSASGARALIATTGFERRGRNIDVIPAIREALSQLPMIDLLIWKDSEKVPAPAGAIEWWDVAAEALPEEAGARMSPNAPFMIMYTSGTTGKPKGVVHTHGGFPLKLAHDAIVHFEIGEGDIFFWPADMGWVAGPMTICATLLRGATLVSYSGAPDFPNWSRMSRIIERHKVTHFLGVPTLLRGMAAAGPLALEGSRSTIRILITGGESIDPDHFLWFRENFGQEDTPLINSTGGTEVSGLLLSSVIVKPIKPASFNTTSPGAAIAVIDRTGRAVIGEIGELAVREPFVGMTSSLWQDDERYLETYWQELPGTWLHGDLAFQAEDGAYTLLGRSDDTLKVAGKRLGPAEVEEIVLHNELVQEAAAIGVQDPKKGEKLALFVVARPGMSIDGEALAAELKSAVAARLGKAFRPSAVYFVKQLPKNRASKVMRRLIKQIANALPLGDLSSLDNPDALDGIRAAMNADAVYSC